MQASSSNASVFDTLCEPVKKWVWKQGWSSLRDVQAKAIPHLLSGGDAIISAATAGGKTEAAFLPLLSRVFQAGNKGSFDVLYISPLKALINDQYDRLKSLCEDLNLPATKWHGDVAANIKQKSLKNPCGVLLITPESLESLLMRKGLSVSRFFGKTQAIVIDELHAFMGTERGVQLRSILNRIEILIGRKIDRVGLSATLGDLEMAVEYLRKGSVGTTAAIKPTLEETNLRLQLRSYVQELPKKGGEEQPSSVEMQIAEHVFQKIRGKYNLVFAGSKGKVETYGATLRDLCSENNLPNEFFVHHANISKSDREALERRLKKGSLPTTAVCTSTLELGIDIGDVEAVVQIGCGGSVSVLRQRLGRSGRREGTAAILRAYNYEYELTGKSHMLDFLRPRLVQAIAEVELLLEGAYEHPSTDRLHLSTFVHQILALIVERGGTNAKNLYNTLCQATPFGNISVETFKVILRAMSQPNSNLIEQAPDGTILLGKTGEHLTSHYSFYAVFETQEEYRVLCKGKNLGTLPLTGATSKGMIIIFSGRRWKIQEVREIDKVIEVISDKGGRPPQFDGNGPSRHRIIDQKMREIYCSDVEYPYLDTQARSLLNESRRNCERYDFPNTPIIEQGDSVILFPWEGSSMIDALLMIFQYHGYKVQNEDYAIEIKPISVNKAHSIINKLACGNIPDFNHIVQMVQNKAMGQYDRFLSDELLNQQLVSIMPRKEALQAWAKRSVSVAKNNNGGIINAQTK